MKYIVYKISTTDLTRHYIGSTIMKLSDRIQQHIYRNSTDHPYSSKCITDTKTFKVDILETGEYLSKKWKCWRERFWIEQYTLRGGCVNERFPNRHWYYLRRLNRKKWNERYRIYYHKNIEKFRNNTKNRVRLHRLRKKLLTLNPIIFYIIIYSLQFYLNQHIHYNNGISIKRTTNN